MKQFVLHHLTRQAERLGQPVVSVPPGSAADLVITLPGGQNVAIYIVNYGLRSPDLADQLEGNTRHAIYSLYILDGRMLPDDGELVEVPHWMSALHGVLHGRVYGYWCQGREVTIRPVHLEWRWGDERRRVIYGQPVEWGDARALLVESASKYLPGRFAAAEFGEGSFWKQRDPNAGRQARYTWRTWSGGPQRPRSSETRGSEETFGENFGDVWGEEQPQFRRRKRTETRRTTPRPGHRHYQVLGIAHDASNDEVKQAYRRKARENHPDLHPNERDKYNMRMAEINAAFEAINREREAGSDEAS
ncbi:MAG: J domain-containing protein [Anaerolineae bacterium]